MAAHPICTILIPKRTEPNNYCDILWQRTIYVYVYCRIRGSNNNNKIIYNKRIRIISWIRPERRVILMIVSQHHLLLCQRGTQNCAHKWAFSMNWRGAYHTQTVYIYTTQCRVYSVMYICGFGTSARSLINCNYSQGKH